MDSDEKDCSVTKKVSVPRKLQEEITASTEEKRQREEMLEAKNPEGHSNKRDIQNEQKQRIHVQVYRHTFNSAKIFLVTS